MQNNIDNKTVVVILIAIAALGGVWYLLTHSSMGTEAVPPITPTTVTTVTSAPQATPVAPAPKPAAPAPTVVPAKVLGVGSVSSLFAMKQSLICTVTTKGSVKLTGAMYVTDSQMRVNFPNSTMINDGKYLYVWMNNASNGTKLLASLSVAGSAMVSNGGFDPAADISYACNSWTKDAGFFVPPSSVSF